MNWKKDQKAIMQGMNHSRSPRPPMPLRTISICYCCFILFIGDVTVLPRASSFSTTSSTTQPSTRSKHNILPKTTESESHLVVDFDNVFHNNIEHDVLSNTESESHLVGRIGNVLNNNGDTDTDIDIDTYNVDLESRRILASILTVGFVFTLIGTHPDIASATADISSSSHPISSNIEIATTTGTVDWNSIFQKATKRAIGGGKAGASAAVVQVLSLMWLRTSMNRQYRYGGDLVSSLKELWKEGGIPRLYQGLQFAMSVYSRLTIISCCAVMPPYLE